MQELAGQARRLRVIHKNALSASENGAVEDHVPGIMKISDGFHQPYSVWAGREYVIGWCWEQVRTLRRMGWGGIAELAMIASMCVMLYF